MEKTSKILVICICILLMDISVYARGLEHIFTDVKVDPQYPITNI